MRRHLVIAGGLAAALLLSACGGGGSSATTTSGGQGGQTSSTYRTAGANPSVASKMVCAPEAQRDIAEAIEVDTTSVTTPTWVDHVYSCSYVYPNGRITLSVKELSSEADTTAYYDSLATKYGKRQDVNGLAQGAFIAKNDDFVVRKDYKVLLVDVSQIPTDFEPASTRTDVGENIAATIMSCWADA